MGLHRVEDTGQHINQRMTFRISVRQEGPQYHCLQQGHFRGRTAETKRCPSRVSGRGHDGHRRDQAIRDSGAFVDIGGLEGLIPVSEISWGRVEDINRVLSVGQRVDVAIKKLDWEKDKFAFSLKAVQPDPWETIGKKYVEGSICKGVVSRLAPFGAFVTLEPGIDGLVHISELGKGKRINHPRDILEENQTIEVKVSKVDEKQKRLSLALVAEDQDA